MRSEQAAANEELARFVSEEKLAGLCGQLSELVTNADTPPGDDATEMPVEAVWLPRRGEAAA